MFVLGPGVPGGPISVGQMGSSEIDVHATVGNLETKGVHEHEPRAISTPYSRLVDYRILYLAM